MRLKNNNRGMALVTTFMVASVLFVLSGAYTASSLVQSQLVQREANSAKAFYLAEQGIEYAFIESKNNVPSWQWRTHRKNTETNALEPLGACPSVTLLGAGCDGVTKIYSVPNSLGGIVEVKSYADPNNADETWVLSRADVGGIQRILRYRITKRSFFKYLFYYPGDKYFGNTNLDGKGLAGVYVGGNIKLNNATFSNLTELSTGAGKGMYLYGERYNQPINIDKYIGGNTSDGLAPLPSLAGRIYTDSNLRPWGTDYNYSVWPMMDWRADPLIFVSAAGKINGVNLPRQINEAPWQWQRLGNKPSDEKDVQYQGVNSQGALAVADNDFKALDGNGQEVYYWDEVAKSLGCPNGSGCAASSSDPRKVYWCSGRNDTSARCLKNGANPDFWPDKIYKRGEITAPQGKSPGNYREVTYLNTLEANQEAAFYDWAKDQAATIVRNETADASKKLSEIVRVGANGKSEAAPNIKTSFSKQADEKGLYISVGGPTPKVRLNGKDKLLNDLGWISEKSFFNTLRPKRGVNSVPIAESVLELDIKSLIDNGFDPPENGVIYVEDKNIRIVNAKKLPKSLTIVSPYNVYIKGDFNYDAGKPEDWKPAAVLSNSIVYALSNNFNLDNSANTLPATMQPREYPNEISYVSSAKDNLNYDTDSKSAKLAVVKQEVENFFGLTNFDEINNLSGSTTQQRAADLVKKIRDKHQAQYSGKMPNAANDTTIKVAIASPYDTNSAGWEKNDYNLLERWQGKSLKIQGSFIQLKNDGFGVGAPRDVPDLYYNKRTGIANNAGQDPIVMNNKNWTTLMNPGNARVLEYDVNLGDPNKEKLSADFFAGSQSLWQEVSDFDNHTSF